VLDKKQNSYIGRKAHTYRYIYEADGTLVEKQDMGGSSYQMRPNLYHYNPLDGDPATWVNGVPPQPEPEQPVVTPDPPADPSVPDAPVTPGTPDGSDVLVPPSEGEQDPEQNGESQTPPEQSGQPETPEQPEQPAQPEPSHPHDDLKPGELPPGY